MLETIGDDPSVAMDRLREKAFEFEAAALGKAELPTPPTPKPSSPLVAECIADFIEETTLTKNLHIERKCYQFWPTRYWAAWFTAESEPSSPLPYRSRRSAQHAQRRTTLSRALEDPLKGR